MWFQHSSCQLVKFKWIALEETLGMYPNGEKNSCRLGPQDLPCDSNSICLISLDEFAIRQPIATQNQFDMWKSDATFFVMLIEDRICKVECKLTQQVSVRYASRFWGLTKRKDGTRRRFKSLVFQTAAIDAMGCVQQPHFMGAIATSTARIWRHAGISVSSKKDSLPCLKTK